MAEFGELRLVWLEAFVRVAETGKRTAAAVEMGIHQGTVTKHIQKLEQWLGGRILLDDNVPTRLWPDGEAFLPVARQVLELLGDARVSPEVIEEARRRGEAAQASPAPRISLKDLKVPSLMKAPDDGSD